MSKTSGRLSLRSAMLAALVSRSGHAQQQTQRVVGTIEAVDGPTLVVKTRQGEVKVNVTDNVTVFGVERRTLADIKPGQFLGVGAMPQPDGSQKAVRVKSSRRVQSPNPGFRPWEGAPQGTMTNANVETSVAGVDGHVADAQVQGRREEDHRYAGRRSSAPFRRQERAQARRCHLDRARDEKARRHARSQSRQRRPRRRRAAVGA